MVTCKCTPCCENVLRVTSISNTGGGFFFVTNSTITPKNGCKYILVVPCYLLPQTAITSISQVYVTINGTNIPLQECIGNNVYTDQIRCFNVDKCGNIVLRLVYGSTPAHFKIVSQRLCCSNAYGTPATAPAATASFVADEPILEETDTTEQTCTGTQTKSKSATKTATKSKNE